MNEIESEEKAQIVNQNESDKNNQVSNFDPKPDLLKPQQGLTLSKSEKEFEESQLMLKVRTTFSNIQFAPTEDHPPQYPLFDQTDQEED